jgi:SAM-dependent methyltransferase
MADRLFADATLAALYDRLNARRRRADFDFYLPMVMAANAVLDVGCGTGAMLKEARTAGHTGRLCGLDPAAGMLAEARLASDIEWIEGDLASVAWDGAFELVVMTGHTIQVFIEDDELRTALAAIRNALTPDGRFAFETRNPSAREWERWAPDQGREVTDAAGRKVRVSRHVAKPFDGRTLSFTHTFTSPDWSGPETSHSTLRFLDAPSLTEFLAAAGLAIEAQFGDWDRSLLIDTSPEIITIARRG